MSTGVSVAADAAVNESVEATSATPKVDLLTELLRDQTLFG
jgi:hypothetical protein